MSRKRKYVKPRRPGTPEPVRARWDATIDGVRPRKGLVVVNHARRRYYGTILMVRQDGTVVTTGLFGSKPEIHPLMLIDGGYSYAPEIPEGYMSPEEVVARAAC